jgi:transporter family-2 protein
MTPLPLLIVVAAVGGAATAFQAQFMGMMDRGIGTLESVFITYASGAMLIALVMLTLRGGTWQRGRMFLGIPSGRASWG